MPTLTAGCWAATLRLSSAISGPWPQSSCNHGNTNKVVSKLYAVTRFSSISRFYFLCQFLYNSLFCVILSLYSPPCHNIMFPILISSFNHLTNWTSATFFYQLQRQFIWFSTICIGMLRGSTYYCATALGRRVSIAVQLIKIAAVWLWILPVCLLSPSVFLLLWLSSPFSESVYLSSSSWLYHCIIMTPTFPWVSLSIVSFMSLLLYYNDPYLSLS